ncbi:MAG: DUF3021 domain-containing protein [Lachnospiraceae bacterium]|nr:DUF3021 domain-containing protein [Lachnospiraceae bacterium]
MNRMKKTAIILSLVGGFTGAAICFVLSSMSGGNGEASVSTGKLVFYYVISFLHGAICMGSSVIYNVEQWSIARCTFTHFLITMTSMNILNLLLDWMPIGSPEYLIIMSIFVVAYFMVWLIFFLCYRREVRKMNDELKKMKDAE